jgi:hypothetical protein
MRRQREENKGSIRVQLHMNIDAHRYAQLSFRAWADLISRRDVCSGDVTRVRFNASGEILLTGARDNEIKVGDCFILLFFHPFLLLFELVSLLLLVLCSGH